MRSVVALMLAVLCLAGCRNTADVSLTGTIGALAPGDSVFVTLSRDWERGIVAPVSFQIDEEGRFAIRFVVEGTPPPLTIVKNNTAFARLEIKDAWGYAPVLVDKIGGAEFPLRVVSDGYLTGKVTLP